KHQLIALGIPEDDIIADSSSKTTEENAINTAKILKKNHLEKVFLETSAFHMRRAVMCFRRAHVEIIPIPTDYSVSVKTKYNFNSFAPSYSGLSTTGTALREYLGIIAMMFK
ncbi:MAG: YdcF family protein, partial [Rubrobacteridae bacterium]|nr:YdcF family protein [Rubrobacteridae bacterium]